MEEEARKDVDGGEVDLAGLDQGKEKGGGKLPDMPKMEKTVSLLGKRFREILAPGS